jgi:acyl-CoA thioester hydrolase
MYEYTRAVYYYETDKMGVVHHSNYARWLEEARTSFFNDNGVPYVQTEEEGVLIPVIDMELKFKRFARYGDTFTVKLRMTKYTGVRFIVKYTVINQYGQILLEASSSHAFVGLDYRPVALPRTLPERHEAMKRLVEA